MHDAAIVTNQFLQPQLKADIREKEKELQAMKEKLAQAKEWRYGLMVNQKKVNNRECMINV